MCDSERTSVDYEAEYGNVTRLSVVNPAQRPHDQSKQASTQNHVRSSNLWAQTHEENKSLMTATL